MVFDTNANHEKWKIMLFIAQTIVREASIQILYDNPLKSKHNTAKNIKRWAPSQIIFKASSLS